MILVDDGPDENHRYRETIRFACANFIHLELDALFIATQAPGRSAFNPVERRMAPLSRFLAGIILPHDTFGSHLNARGETVDVDRERENFQKAGETLAEVWNEAVIGCLLTSQMLALCPSFLYFTVKWIHKTFNVYSKTDRQAV